MAWTQDDLDRINRAISNGRLSVQYEDRRVQYRSLQEMLQIRQLMRDELEGSSGRVRRTYARHDKGL
ncbi:MAG: hypothetical protein AAGB93_00650 [Planctomycetota bacterium]